MSADVFAPLREAVEQLIASQGSADPKQHLSARRKLAANGPLLSRLLREHAEAMALLAEFVDDDECQYDHHGYCQTHRLGERPCETERARKLLSSSPHPTDNQT